MQKRPRRTEGIRVRSLFKDANSLGYLSWIIAPSHFDDAIAATAEASLDETSLDEASRDEASPDKAML